MQQLQLDETKNQSAALSSEIDRIKAAFQCQVGRQARTRGRPLHYCAG